MVRITTEPLLNTEDVDFSNGALTVELPKRHGVTVDELAEHWQPIMVVYDDNGTALQSYPYSTIVNRELPAGRYTIVFVAKGLPDLRAEFDIAPGELTTLLPSPDPRPKKYIDLPMSERLTRLFEVTF